MVECHVRGPLRFGVALNLNVRTPKAVPGFAVAFQQALAAFEGGKNCEAFGFVVRVGHVLGRGHRTHHAEAVSFARLHFFRKLQAVQVVIPLFVNEVRFFSPAFVENKTVGRRHRVPTRGGFGHRGHERNQRVRSVDEVVAVLHVAEQVGGRQHAVRRDFAGLFRRERHLDEGGVRQVPERDQRGFHR